MIWDNSLIRHLQYSPFVCISSELLLCDPILLQLDDEIYMEHQVNRLLSFYANQFNVFEITKSYNEDTFAPEYHLILYK